MPRQRIIREDPRLAQMPNFSSNGYAPSRARKRRQLHCTNEHAIDLLQQEWQTRQQLRTELYLQQNPEAENEPPADNTVVPPETIVIQPTPDQTIERMPSPITNTGNPDVLDQAIEDIVTELQLPVQDNVALSTRSQPFVHRPQNNNNNNNNSNINYGTSIQTLLPRLIKSLKISYCLLSSNYKLQTRTMSLQRIKILIQTPTTLLLLQMLILLKLNLVVEFTKSCQTSIYYLFLSLKSCVTCDTSSYGFLLMKDLNEPGLQKRKRDDTTHPGSPLTLINRVW